MDDAWIMVLRDAPGWAIAIFLLVRVDRKLARMNSWLSQLTLLVAVQAGMDPKSIEAAIAQAPENGTARDNGA